MAGKTTRRILVASCAAALTAGLAVVAPAARAASDPETRINSAVQSYQPAGRAASVDGLAPRLVPTLDANAAIAARLPQRSLSAAIGRNFAVNVVDVDSGQTIWSRTPSAPKLPASNMKVITAIDALRTLGPDTRFTTKVVALGRGKLVIVGGGDATLSGTGMTDLATQAAAAINARQDLLPPMITPDPYRPSKCRSNGKLRRSTKKHPCPIVTPGPRRAATKIYVDDSLYPAPTRPAGWGGGYEPVVVRPVRALGLDGRYVMDSGADAANYLGKAMKASGLPGKFAGRQTASPGAAELASHAGSTVYDQVREMLQVSENNIAELLVRNVAIATGHPATWEGGSAAAMSLVSSLGIPTAGLSLTSGSGVGRNDRLTPVALTTAMQFAADSVNHPELKALYYGGGLPRAGVNGTLAPSTGRFTTRPTKCAAGKILAKTGTLFDTIGLSGLATGADGKLKAFSILVNRRPQRFSPLATRKRVDRIAATITGCY